MKHELFNELVEGIRDAGSVLRGGKAPARVTFVGEPDPRAIRDELGLTQEQFARALSISVKTLRNWEQGRRAPSGPAMRLLQIAARHPQVIMEAA